MRVEEQHVSTSSDFELSRNTAETRRLRPLRCQEILRGGYTLDDKQTEIYEDFTEMLADFDLYMMVNILEDALKDAQKKTMLADYSC